MTFPPLNKTLTAVFKRMNCKWSLIKTMKKRFLKTERNTEKVMLKRKVNYDNIAREVRTASCCSKRCIQSILTISDIFKTREWLSKKVQGGTGAVPFKFFPDC